MWRHVRAIGTAAVIASCAFSGWLAWRLRGSRVVQGDAASKHDNGTAGPSGATLPGVSNLSAADTALIALYDKMGSELLATNLNAAAILAMHPMFHGVAEKVSDVGGNGDTGSHDTLPWPKRYDEFDPPLPPHAVRLLVIPLDGEPDLAAAGAAITSAVLRVLPPGTKVFSNARSHYHCTMFHTSHPLDPRPDATAPHGGVDLQLPPAQRRGPTAAELGSELAIVQRAVASSEPPVLRLHRILLASSGTLLMTWLDHTGHVAELRGRLHQAFPGASSKQATIIHSSLTRIMSTTPLPAATLEAVQRVCDEWTAKLRGRTFVPTRTWFVQESEFSSIYGDRDVIAYKHS